MHIFISHSSENTEEVHHLTQSLNKEELKFWLASRDIKPGDTWATSIMNAIESSSVILLLLSESANSSQQVSREVEEAVRLNIPIIPVIMGSFQVSKGLMYFINSHQWIDAANKPVTEWIPKVISTLKPFSTVDTKSLPHKETNLVPNIGTTSQNLNKQKQPTKHKLTSKAIYIFGIILLFIAGYFVSQNLFIKQLASQISIFNHAVHLMDEGKYNDAISGFQNFAEEYPGHSLAPIAVYNTALISELTGSTSAGDLYSTFAEAYPQSSLAGIALYKATIAYEANGMQVEALQNHSLIAKDSTFIIPFRIPSLCKYADYLYDASAFEGAKEYYIKCVQLDDSLRHTYNTGFRAYMLNKIDTITFRSYACRSAYRIALIEIEELYPFPVITANNVREFAQNKASVESWLGKCMSYNVSSYFIASCALASDLYVDFANSVAFMDPPPGLPPEAVDEFYNQLYLHFYEPEMNKAIDIALVALEYSLRDEVISDSEAELITRLATCADNLSPGSTLELGIPDSIYMFDISEDQISKQLDIEAAVLSTASSLDEALIDGRIAPYEAERIVYYASRLDELSPGATVELGIPDSIYAYPTDSRGTL